jgi:hypothetical protein
MQNDALYSEGIGKLRPFRILYLQVVQKDMIDIALDSLDLYADLQFIGHFLRNGIRGHFPCQQQQR